MARTIENYKFSITIATAVVIILSLTGMSFKIGAEQRGIEDDIRSIQKNNDEYSRMWASQNRLNRRLLEAVTIIQTDVKHLLQNQAQLMDTQRSGEADER